MSQPQSEEQKSKGTRSKRSVEDKPSQLESLGEVGQSEDSILAQILKRDNQMEMQRQMQQEKNRQAKVEQAQKRQEIMLMQQKKSSK